MRRAAPRPPQLQAALQQLDLDAVSRRARADVLRGHEAAAGAGARRPRATRGSCCSTSPSPDSTGRGGSGSASSCTSSRREGARWCWPRTVFWRGLDVADRIAILAGGRFALDRPAAELSWDALRRLYDDITGGSRVTAYARRAWFVLWKDLLTERRSKENLNALFFFSLLLLFVFQFALGPDRRTPGGRASWIALARLHPGGPAGPRPQLPRRARERLLGGAAAHARRQVGHLPGQAGGQLPPDGGRRAGPAGPLRRLLRRGRSGRLQPALALVLRPRHDRGSPPSARSSPPSRRSCARGSCSSRCSCCPPRCRSCWPR